MIITQSHLIQMSLDASVLMKAADWGSASKLYEVILKEHPNWEHGYGWFQLAHCYEEAGQIEEAGIAYEHAFKTNPTDTIIMGGLASFLYLHGNKTSAYNLHVQLIALERKKGETKCAAVTMIALNKLGEQLGLTNKEIESDIVKQMTR
jgi:tetratricopeptide (TPR) repeat protein